MNNAPWTALPQRRVQRCQHQLGAQVIGRLPAYPPPASATTAMMDVADTGLENSIILSTRRQLTVLPGVVPAQGDAEQMGHLGRWGIRPDSLS